ncbi:MAG: peptide MFS transporter [Blastocatellia bacterium]|nr:peptide MFS transporter [Blastocatellia bacterium]
MAMKTADSQVALAGGHTVDKHPKGLYVLFATEMWERFSFYSMLALFTLYMQNAEEGFGWSASQATGLYANYLMFVYASPLIGGWLADKKLGYRKAVMIGGFFFMAGHLLLSFRSLPVVYAALTCLVIGNGLFKPNVSTMVGNLYPEGSHLKDRAYNIFYMGINIGAFTAPIVMEIVKSRVGNHPAFAVAAFGMVISVGILWWFKSHVEDPKRADIQAKAASDSAADTESKEGEGARTSPTTPGGMFAANAPHPRQTAMDAVPERNRIIALLVIFLIVIVFWMVFHQNGSTLTYWADDNTDWDVSGTISNAINPFWVVTLTFPLVWMWQWLDKRGKEPSTPTKMAMGMTLSGLSFFILFIAAKSGEAVVPQPDSYASASFRVTQRSLDFMRTEGVPESVLTRLAESKDSEDKPIVKDRKFSRDKTFSNAFETIKLNLKSEGISQDVENKLKEAKIEDGELASGGFSAALERTVQSLRTEGVPDDVLTKIRAHRDKTFTGEEKLSDAVSRVLSADEAARHNPVTLRYAYLFLVSPFWLILSYAVVTLGELMLSPMGLALVSKVAPIRMRGLMMGGWFVATAAGNKLTMIGVFWDQWMQSTFFAVLGAMALVMAVVLFLLLKPLKKAMPGV